MPDRSLWSIDIARAGAACSVFVYHYGVGALLAGMTHVQAFQLLAWPGANIAVPLFFALSGYCIHGSELARLANRGGTTAGFDDWRGYYRRRFLRIYPVFFIALVFSCVVNVLQGHPPTAADIGAHVVLAHGFSSTYFNTINLVLWTISIESCFYLIYPAWLRLRLRIGLGWALLVGGAISALSCALTAVFFFPYTLPAIWFFLSNWFGWLAGGWLAEAMAADPKPFRRVRWWVAGVAATAACVVASRAGWFTGRGQVLEVPARVLICLWPLSGLVLLESFLRAQAADSLLRGWMVGGLRQLGLASYSLYLLHEPLIDLRNHLHRHLASGGLKSAIFAAWFFLILGLCWLSYRFLERFFLTRRKTLLVSPLPAAAAGGRAYP